MTKKIVNSRKKNKYLDKQLIILINNYKQKDNNARNVAFTRNFLNESSRISFNNITSMRRLNTKENISMEIEQFEKKFWLKVNTINKGMKGMKS